MAVLDDLLAALPADRPAQEVHIGIHWTTVGLASGPGGQPARFGLAKTLLPQEGPGHNLEHGSVADAGRLQEHSAHALAHLARSPSGPERAVGWAAINALVVPDPARCVELNARDYLVEHGAGKRVVVVGHFPFVEQVRRAARQLWVLELNPAPGDTPASAAPEVLPQADIVAVTSLTLLNDTFEQLTSLWRRDATVMLLGPSTPFSPLLFDHGIGILSGTEIVDPALANRCICQGASFQQVRGVRLLTMTRAGL